MKKFSLIIILCFISIAAFGQQFFLSTLGDVLNGNTFENHLEKAKKGDVEAMFNVAVDYYYGNGVEESASDAVTWYRKAADKGHMMSQIRLADAYYLGEGITQSYTQALNWYKKAAAKGSYCAMCTIGGMYYHGEGVTKSYSEAINWWKKASALGEMSEEEEKWQHDVWDGLADINLGDVYMEGNGVPEDYKLAFQYYVKAADHGNSEANLTLAQLYYYGIGTEQSYTSAVKYVIEAVNSDDETENATIKWLEDGIEDGFEDEDDKVSKEFLEILRDFIEKNEDDVWSDELTLEFVDDLMVKFGYKSAPSPVAPETSQTTVASTSTPSTTTSSSDYTPSDSYSHYHYHRFNTPDWDTRAAGLSIGYVQKQWNYRSLDGSASENHGIFSDEGEKSMVQGIQAGFRAEPQFGYGFGLNTGLFYEYYFYKSNDYLDDEGLEFYANWEEHSLYAPVHLEYRANFSDSFQFFVYGGAGLDYSLYSKYKGHYYMDDYVTDPIDVHGDDSKPFNASWEAGAGIRIKGFQIQWQMSRGLIDMATEGNDYKVYQNKPMTISISWML